MKKRLSKHLGLAVGIAASPERIRRCDWELKRIEQLMANGFTPDEAANIESKERRGLV